MVRFTSGNHLNKAEVLCMEGAYEGSSRSIKQFIRKSRLDAPELLANVEFASKMWFKYGTQKNDSTNI